MSNDAVAAGLARADFLKPYFERVCNPTDWKAPIDATIKPEDLLHTIEAIEWYCATPTTVKVFQMGGKTLCEVSSIGYRNGPAGP